MEQMPKYKTFLWIVVVLIALVVSVALLRQEYKKTVDTKNGTQVNETRKAPSVKTPDQAHVDQLTALGYPETLPKGLLPEDSQKPQKVEMQSGTTIVVGTLSMDYLIALQWYSPYVKSNGWKVTQEPEPGEPVIKMEKGNQKVSVELKPVGGFTQLNIYYAEAATAK